MNAKAQKCIYTRYHQECKCRRRCRIQPTEVDQKEWSHQKRTASRGVIVPLSSRKSRVSHMYVSNVSPNPVFAHLLESRRILVACLSFNRAPPSLHRTLVIPAGTARPTGARVRRLLLLKDSDVLDLHHAPPAAERGCVGVTRPIRASSARFSSPSFHLGQLTSSRPRRHS